MLNPGSLPKCRSLDRRPLRSPPMHNPRKGDFSCLRGSCKCSFATATNYRGPSITTHVLLPTLIRLYATKR
jgi:hypothetical protein